MEPAIEAIAEPMVEEAHIPAHPLEAPQQAHSEVVTAEADSDQTPPAEESEENTTE